MAGLGTSSLVYTYKWELKDVENKPMTILSKTIHFCCQLTFRIGLKNSPAPTLFFIAINLNKMGMKVTDITYKKARIPGDDDDEVNAYRNRMVLQDQEDDEGSIQLFTDKTLDDIVTGSHKFTFNIYVEGIVDSYQIQRCDYLLRDELWSNSFGRDFEFIAEGKRFPVHKFILSARSPVFAALFSGTESSNSYAIGLNNQGSQPGESAMSQTTSETYSSKILTKSGSPNAPQEGKTSQTVTTIQQIYESVDAACMENFLSFIYTGQLGDPCCHKMKYLAEKYQIKTLMEICEAAASNVDGNTLAPLALDYKSDEIEAPLRITPEEYCGISFVNVAGVVSFTLELEREGESGKESWTGSKTFDYQEKKNIFRVEANLIKAPGSTEADQYPYTIRLVLLGFQLDRINCRIREVGYCDESGDDYWNEQVPFKEIPTSNGNLLQKFTKSDVFASPPNSITFHIQLESTLPNFFCDFVDCLFKDQLWGAACPSKLTDVVLLVGDQSVDAHRFILSARSPIFAAMFKSGMSECQTSRVRIEGTDPTTFRYFLKFLYTSMLEPSADRQALFVLADKYLVETLKDCCKTAVQPLDVEEFTKVFCSC